MERVEADKKEAWILEHRSGADIRLLGNHFDRAGKRSLGLKEAVAIMKESPLTDFPMVGPRGFKELHHSVAEAGVSWTQYHDEWEHRSGVSEGSAVCHVHRNISEISACCIPTTRLTGRTLQRGSS